MNYQILINKNNSLEKDYIPSNLVKVNKKFTNNKVIYLERRTYHSLKKLIKYIIKKYNYQIIITMGYKPYFYQLNEFKDYFQLYNKKTYHLLELPSHSEYQTGLAFNLVINNEKIYQEVLNHLSSYGFILRYPQDKELITNFSFQRNHFRFVGRVAKYMKENNLTLEEL